MGKYNLINNLFLIHILQTFATDFFLLPQILTLKLNFRQIVSYLIIRDVCMWFCFNQQFTSVIIFMNDKRDLYRPKLNPNTFHKKEI